MKQIAVYVVFVSVLLSFCIFYAKIRLLQQQPSSLHKSSSALYKALLLVENNLWKSLIISSKHQRLPFNSLHYPLLIVSEVRSRLSFKDCFDFSSLEHFFSTFVDTCACIGFMKVNSSILGVGHDLFQAVSCLKKSLGSLELEATLTILLFLSLDWLAFLLTSSFYLPSNIQKIIILAIHFRTISNNILTAPTMKQKQKSKDKKKEVEKEVESNDEEVEQTNFIEIEKLQEHGINAADIAKLKSSGFCTITSIVMATKKELVNIKGINQAKIDKILEAAKKIENHGFITGSELAEKRKNIIRITTGSAILDELLGGGIESMAITQAFGEFRTGKTQLAHTLCVTTQLPKEKGGGNGKVIYIDTEGTFRPERICKIAERYQMDPQETLDNIKYARGYTVQHLIALLNFAAAMMMESPHSLLIIDSIMAVFRNDFTGRGELSERQQVLGKVLSKLIKLAEQFNVAIYMTNQVMADPGNTMAHADPKKPIGGHVLAHASTTRLYFRKGKAQQRICKIFDSPCLAQNEATFEISEGGIIDAKD